MNEQELNKKLVEWAGFYQSDETPLGKCTNGAKTWYAPDHHWIGGYLSADFTQSLDACFKWLVPKLWVCQYVLDEGTFHVWMVSRPNKEGKATPRCSALDEFNPALALCLAIEKLIDKEKNNG